MTKLYGKFQTVDDYLAAQPDDRKAVLQSLRQTIKQALPQGFEETMQYDMISYVVPYRLYPNGYHVKPHLPLPFIGLANQLHYIALYHMGIYNDPKLLAWFVDAYQQLNIGKLDMGKSCIRFKKLNQIPFKLIGELCQQLSVEQYISNYEAQINGKV